MIRLRQVALASRRLDAVVDELSRVFDLKVAYNDPAIIHYGLRNAVLPAGQSFIEVVEPVREGASAGRFLDRWGGDAGYMVILQTDDAVARSAAVAEQGVRVVDALESDAYIFRHFHPADWGGVLVSFDQQRTETDPLKAFGDWTPAGPDWRGARSAFVRDLRAVTIASTDADAMALRWAALLGAPTSESRSILLAMGEIRFANDAETPRTAVSAVELAVADPGDARVRAKVAGLPCDDRGVKIGGIWFAPVQA